jgi:hypothetical protein
MKPTVILRGGPSARPAEPVPATPAAGSWTTGLATLAAAVVLVAGVTILQGVWTERWSGRDVGAALERDAAILERVFPEQFGDWEILNDQRVDPDPKELERAGAVGHVSRRYRNVRTKGVVSVFVVCATPHNASGHTPDRCYPSAGFEVGESEHRQTVPMADGRKAETFNGTFRKQGQTIRIFWTYGGDGTWVAPQIARIELAGRDAVYKLYAIIDETRLKAGQSMQDSANFLGTLLPALDQAVAAARAGEPPATAPAKTPEPAAEQATTAATPANG